MYDSIKRTGKICLIAAVLLLAGGLPDPAAAETARDVVRLAVNEDGIVTLDGKPWRGVGVNFFSAFRRTLDNPEDTSYTASFQELAAFHIPFVRFMCGGFFPAEWKQYLEDKEGYFARLDGVVEAAEKAGIGLIPSVFWFYAGVPDTVGEPVNQIGNPHSKTADFMRTYLTDLVTRYASRPSIWAWEVGNEYNLAADLPNAADHLPMRAPSRGTPSERTMADAISSADILAAMQLFVDTVSPLDPHRLLTSGHSILRPSQYHQRIESSWKRDTTAQYCRELLRSHPEPFKLISVHLYPEAQTSGYFNLPFCSYEHHLATLIATAAPAGKAVFVGEFGAASLEERSGAEGAQENFYQLLKAIETSGVPLAALWVYDFPYQEKSCNVTSSNARSYQLEALKELNLRLQAPGQAP
ncbi:MAG TPA: cellulase family glycosylhydrolase [Candidatus Hydrogenedentes bacterium]|nr:cellulase family glycosylhydrolase [Candidatus Hydrogenedentota bacterium]